MTVKGRHLVGETQKRGLGLNQSEFVYLVCMFSFFRILFCFIFILVCFLVCLLIGFLS